MALNTDALTTVATARVYLGETAADQARLEALINAYSRTIRNFTGRQFLPNEASPVAKKFRYDGLGMLLLGQSSSWATELRTVSSVVMFSDLKTADQVTLSAGTAGVVEADYRLGPRQGTRESTYLWFELPEVPANLIPLGPSPGGFTLQPDAKKVEVTITGAWGANTTPGDVELACLIAVANGWRNPEAFASRSLGDFSFSDGLDQRVDTGRALPADARALLYDYRRDAYLS